ncbi:hypothetical protein OUZ56_003353 [Daphnia magna]|uniref:Uncharacterized protein n=1 Tax=Daphnia magna TaxID=35525 RepID=A0ABR0A8G6_9CRUS|nr:hypothetical protein OUZ56_003353 [Daphnia magna]
MKSLTDFVANQREIFDDFEKEALKLIPNGKYRGADKIPRRRRQQVGGPSEEVVLSGQTRFRQALISRTNAYSKDAGLFGFLNNGWRLDFDILIEKATILQTQYSSDLEKSFPDELTHFSLYIQQYLETEIPDFDKSFTVNMMYQTLFTQKVQLPFPNVEIALRIYLSLMQS